MEIQDASQLKAMLKEKAKAVLNDVSEKVYNLLIECIQRDIYDKPEGWYKRHPGKNGGGFIGAFKLDALKASADLFTRELFYDWQNMIIPGSGRDDNPGNDHGYYTHGYGAGGVDRREDLWWILNSQGWNDIESEFGGAIGPRDGHSYLDDFYDELLANWLDWVEEAANKQGLEIVKSGNIW